VQNTILF